MLSSPNGAVQHCKETKHLIYRVGYTILQSIEIPHFLFQGDRMSDKTSTFDWVLALIVGLALKENVEYKEAVARQQAEIKPFWWEAK